MVIRRREVVQRLDDLAAMRRDPHSRPGDALEDEAAKGQVARAQDSDDRANGVGRGGGRLDVLNGERAARTLGQVDEASIAVLHRVLDEGVRRGLEEHKSAPFAGQKAAVLDERRHRRRQRVGPESMGEQR